MKGEHYHYFVSWTSSAGITSSDCEETDYKLNTQSNIYKFEDELSACKGFRINLINFYLLECDCEQNPEDQCINEVLHAIKEREKCKANKRMMGNE